MSEFLEYTKHEIKQLENIDKKYRPEINRLMELVIKSETGSKEFDELLEKENAIHEEWQTEIEKVSNRARERAFNAFGGDVETIVSAIKDQLPTYITVAKAMAGKKPSKKERAEQTAQEAKHRQEVIDGINANERLLADHPGDQELIEATEGLKELLNSLPLSNTHDMIYSDQALKKNINDAFSMYLDFLSNVDIEAYKEIQTYIDECIKNKNKLSLDLVRKKTKENGIIDITTRRPTAFITPVDKVSNKAFDNGQLYSSTLLPVAMEKRGSKKQIDTMVSINFDDMQGVQISGKKELTAYDREVHDAIITLAVNGENEYMTGAMIYQTMVGSPGARLAPKQAEAISDSITKLMYSKVTIDATKEAEAFGFEKFKYDGYVVPAERVTATLNGNIVECIHLFRTPPLYEYADKKNQVGRIDIKLLNSPINKNEETITLQGYLYRRILSIKGSSKLSPTIVYETVYKQIDIDALTDGALRKKKTVVRTKIKEILEYWKKEKFIAGYVENTRKQEIYSVTIRLQ